MNLSSKRPLTVTLVLVLSLVAFAASVFASTSIANADAISSSESIGKVAFSVEHDSAISLSKKAKVKNGLAFDKKGLHYFKNGKKIKSSWKNVKGKRYYFDKNGNAVYGIRTIAGTTYLFNDSGTLHRMKKAKFIERGKYTYRVTKKGQILTNWQVVNNKLYHFTSKGRLDKNTTIDGVMLDESGVAKSSNAAKCKIQALGIIKKTSEDTASRSTKLRNAWSYLVSKRHFRYASIYPNMSKKDWQYDTAYYMLKNRRGNCYSFACAFAAFAQVLGYEPSLALGRIHGSRDGASDGFTRHSWVKINGRYYDPELRFAGSAYVYGMRHYPLSTRNTRMKKF